MHRVSFTPVCVAEGRLWRRLLREHAGLSQLPLREKRAALAQLLPQPPFHRNKILHGAGSAPIPLSGGHGQADPAEYSQARKQEKPPSIPLKTPHRDQFLCSELMIPVITLCHCPCGLEFGLHSRSKGFRGFLSSGLLTMYRHEAAHSCCCVCQGDTKAGTPSGGPLQSVGKPPGLCPTFCFLQKMPFQKQLPLHCSPFLATQLTALSPTQTVQPPALSPPALTW